MSVHITQYDIEPCLLNDGVTMITTITNYGYLLYTCNMLKSLAPYGLDKKVLIIAIDRKAADILKGMGYHVYCVDGIWSQFSPWNSKGYDKICYIKLQVIHSILSLQKNVLLVDGDIVFQKNPMTDLTNWQTDLSIDVWVQNDMLSNHDTTDMCTGYMYIKSTEKMIQLYDCVSEDGQEQYRTCAFDNNDQTYFNRYVRPSCSISPLPLEHYPNGRFFYNMASSPVLIHFNWVVGHLKMAKMKEHKKWLLTPEEEDLIY